MPYANIRGVAINYEILGDRGPPMALSPGGRNRLSAHHADRRADGGARATACCCTTGAIAARRTWRSTAQSEYEVWADDLDCAAQPVRHGAGDHRRQLVGRAARAHLCAAHPQSVRALVLWRVTGGGFAVKRLAERYYDQYVRLAGEGGMAAVCAEEHFAELIRKRPSNRERLMAIDPQEFITIMQAWRAPFVAGAELPLIGTSERTCASIRVPTCIIPGNDLTHDSETGERRRG